MKLNLHYIGSFQDDRQRVICENPLEEVWHEIAHLGTDGFLSKLVPDSKEIDWDSHRKYAAVRIRQAHEFHGAAQQASLLTGPLPLYYSFLNLTRAFLAIGPEVIPRSGHGLNFIRSGDLLSSRAKLSKGTFTDYLTSQGIAWKEGDEISLEEALGFVIEHADSYQRINASQAFVQPVIVRALMRREVRLDFRGYPGDFQASWTKDFPSLAPICAYEGDTTLLVSDLSLGQTDESPRVLRRLQLLREWSHEQVNQVFPRGSGARRTHGAGASGRVPLAVGCH